MSDRTTSSVNALRLVSFAMCAGMLIFLAVTIFMTVEGHSPAAKSPASAAQLGITLLIVTGGIGIGAMMAWLVIRRASENSARRAWQKKDDVATKERLLWAGFSTQSITRMALAEAFGLLGILSLFLGGQWWGLGATGIAIGAILYGLPSQAKYDEFLARATAEV